MITVIIPALNESGTIGSLVEFVRRDRCVDEIIVVDDGSIDGTPQRACAAGAKVVTSTLLGKGASMEDGMKAARNEILLYLDGDLAGLHEDLVQRMTEPISAGWADFVKAKFSRNAGRVTTLTARPLLEIFFPELASFEQPLGGIVAARRSLLEGLRFEADYGVDVGLLIDAAFAEARLAEAFIGHIEHDNQSLEVLGDMATQVVRAILDRAARYGRLHPDHLREIQEVQCHTKAALSLVLQRAGRPRRLALLDMDGVLLSGRFIVHLAWQTGKFAELEVLLDNPAIAPEERTRQIAALFAGVPAEAFEETAREIPLTRGASNAVVALRKAGFHVGVVTDSYSVASEIVRRRVFADFSVAHHMKFREGRATGKVQFAPAMLHAKGCPDHVYCKRNVLLHLQGKLDIDAKDVLAVGDGENDICLLQAAGISVAFRPKCEEVRQAAKYVVWGDLAEIASLLAVHGNGSTGRVRANVN